MRGICYYDLKENDLGDSNDVTKGRVLEREEFSEFCIVFER